MTGRLSIKARSECKYCDRAFRSVLSQDLHRTPGGMCLDPASIGMEASNQGVFGFPVQGRISRRLGGHRPAIVYRRGMEVIPGSLLPGWVFPNYAEGELP